MDFNQYTEYKEEEAPDERYVNYNKVNNENQSNNLRRDLSVEELTQNLK